LLQKYNIEPVAASVRAIRRQNAQRHSGLPKALTTAKDTTYVLNFVNESAEILKAFKTYYETAEM
jgi:hypothetical protein